MHGPSMTNQLSATRNTFMDIQGDKDAIDNALGHGGRAVKTGAG